MSELEGYSDSGLPGIAGIRPTDRYVLHAWVWLDNGDGMFDDTNRQVAGVSNHRVIRSLGFTTNRAVTEAVKC